MSCASVEPLGRVAGGLVLGAAARRRPERVAGVPHPGRPLVSLARLLEPRTRSENATLVAHVAHDERDMGDVGEGARAAPGHWIHTVLAFTNDSVPKLASSRP